MHGTDRAWKHFGATDPYYGVLTVDRFKSDRLDKSTKEEFFETGRADVERLTQTIRRYLDPDFAPGRSLDFGCGVGRLTLPIAQISTSVVGVDISEAMLSEAAENARAQKLDNIDLVRADDSLSRVTGDFDFVYSYIVFQHIAPRRCEALFARLVDMLRDGGIGAIHCTYAKGSQTPRWRQLTTRTYERVPPVFGLRNMIKHAPFSSPLMQMNLHNVNRLLRILQEASCHPVHLEFTEATHFNHPIYGVVFYFRKSVAQKTTAA